MNVYLIRHAEAALKEIDPERNLTEQGVRDAQRLAEILAPLDLRVETVWYSPKPHASQTAAAVASSIAPPGAASVRDGLLSFDPVKPIARLLNRADSDIAIVGHEPFLGRLAARLVCRRASRPLVELDKPSALCLRRDVEGAWRIAWLISPQVVVQSGAEGPAPLSSENFG